MGCLASGRWHHAGPSYGTSMASHSSWPPLLGSFGTWLAWVAKKKWIKMRLHSTIYRGKWPCLPTIGPDENPVARELFHSDYSVPGWATLHGLNLASYSMENIYGEPQKGLIYMIHWWEANKAHGPFMGCQKRLMFNRVCLKFVVPAWEAKMAWKHWHNCKNKCFLSLEIDIGFRQVWKATYVVFLFLAEAPFGSDALPSPLAPML